MSNLLSSPQMELAAPQRAGCRTRCHSAEPGACVTIHVICFLHDGRRGLTYCEYIIHMAQ